SPSRAPPPRPTRWPSWCSPRCPPRCSPRSARAVAGGDEPARAMSRLRITGLRRTFPGRPPVDALRSVDLTVEEGSLTAVLGPSGCGKTTLLRTVAGMERADGGTVEIGDATVAGPGLHVPPERRTV